MGGHGSKPRFRGRGMEKREFRPPKKQTKNGGGGEDREGRKEEGSLQVNPHLGGKGKSKGQCRRRVRKGGKN